MSEPCPKCGERESGPHRCGWEFIGGLELLQMGDDAREAYMKALKRRGAVVVYEMHLDGMWVKRTKRDE